MGFVTKPEAYVISEIKSTIMDRLHMGGSFLQQSQSVTVGGLPVAIRQGGLAGAAGLAGGLSGVIGAVQAAGSIASLVQNPLDAIQGAIAGELSGLTSQVSGLSGVLSGGQLSDLNSALSSVSSALTTFETHTSLLSGVATSISDTIPDLNKLLDVGNTITGLGTESRDGFLQNTASALFSDNTMNDVNETLRATVSLKLTEISRLDPATQSGEIDSKVEEVKTLLNTQASTMTNIVDSDVHNFNEAGNNVTAATSVLGVAEKFADTNSVGYSLFNRVGKESTINTFSSVITSAS
jgi:hypothetical protein